MPQSKGNATATVEGDLNIFPGKFPGDEDIRKPGARGRDDQASLPIDMKLHIPKPHVLIADRRRRFQRLLGKRFRIGYRD